jgi:hypothetical protein
MTTADPLRHAYHSALALAEHDPLRAARALVRGLQIQTPGGRLTVLRAFVQALIERDPSLSIAIAQDLAAISKQGD